MSEPEHARIEVRLRDLSQLFNSMDPSPFLDRDLDADAEEFIVGWARELPSHAELELVVYLANPPPPEAAAGAGDAVRHYFSTREEIRRRDFRQLMRRGRISLLVGLLFLAVCFGLSELVAQLGYGTPAEFVRESLVIVGWVAMWRPLEIYLYDWWPLRSEQRMFERLARITVNLVLPKKENS